MNDTEKIVVRKLYAAEVVVEVPRGALADGAELPDYVADRVGKSDADLVEVAWGRVPA